MNISRLLKQDITYWELSSIDGWNKPTFESSPEYIKGRWEDKAELYLDKEGQEKISNAIVYLDQDVELGGYLYLGTSLELDPTLVDNAYEIKYIHKVSDIKGTTFLRKIIL